MLGPGGGASFVDQSFACDSCKELVASFLSFGVPRFNFQAVTIQNQSRPTNEGGGSGRRTSTSFSIGLVGFEHFCCWVVLESNRKKIKVFLWSKHIAFCFSSDAALQRYRVGTRRVEVSA